jgi:Domain of unknown function (DUF222)/HNH endonuclease
MFGEADNGCLSPEQADVAAEELLFIQRLRDRLGLRAARIAADLASVEYGETMGSISTLDWIRHECKMGFQAAADLVCVGQEMDSLGASVAAVEDSEIGYQHLVFMARTKRAVGERPINEEHLLAEAKAVSVGRFWHVCQQARHAADSEGMAREQAEAVEQRALRLNQQQDGSVTVSGILDPLGGAAVKAALEPLARKSGKEDERCRERRLADALVELSHHAMDQSTPRQRPHLNVTATLGTLYCIPGSAAAELDHGMPVSEVTVNRIACDCAITRHVFESGSVLVDLGREKRVVSPKLRKTLESRDKHCRWPGCTRPASWCEAHHVVSWVRGGATNQSNLLLLCNRHHMQVHEGRWQLFLYPDGGIKVLRPPLDFAAPPRGPALDAAA